MVGAPLRRVSVALADFFSRVGEEGKSGQGEHFPSDGIEVAVRLSKSGWTIDAARAGLVISGLGGASAAGWWTAVGGPGTAGAPGGDVDDAAAGGGLGLFV